MMNVEAIGFFEVHRLVFYSCLKKLLLLSFAFRIFPVNEWSLPEERQSSHLHKTRKVARSASEAMLDSEVYTYAVNARIEDGRKRPIGNWIRGIGVVFKIYGCPVGG